MRERERTFIARTKQFLERSLNVKVRVEELEGLLGPETVDVDLRRILKEARDEQGRRIFETLPPLRGSREVTKRKAEDGMRE